MSNRSLSASSQGQEKLRTALERRNLTQKSLSYEGSADGIAAWSTINRFFNGKPIQRQLFIKICDELNLDWQDIAEFPEESTPLDKLWLQLIKLGSPTEDMGLVLAKEQTLGWGTKSPSRYEKSVSVGAYIQVEVNLNIQGYLLLLLKDTSGEVCCFCPSCFAPENKLEAGKTTLPQADSPITYVEAEKYYDLALSLKKQLLGENHPDVAFSLNNLSTLYAAIKRYEDALSYRIQASHIHDKLISNVFAFSSENDRLAFIDKIRGNFDLFLSLIYQYLPNSQEAINSAFDFILKRKGLSATSLTAQNQAFYNGKYPHLTEKFQQLRELSNQIIHLTITASQTRNLDNYQTNLNQLQNQYDNLQKQIATQVPEIQLSQQIPNRETVTSALPTNSVLIEFVQIDIFDFQAIRAKGEKQWQSFHYLAFILSAGKPHAVQMIDLGEVKKIDELISKFRLQVCDINTQTLGLKKSISVKPKLQIKQYNPTDSIQLSKLILSPIIEKIDNNCQKIIFAADGNLNSVPLQILPIDETGKRLLMDEYTVSYLGVGRDILRSDSDSTDIADKPIVIADPDFELAAPLQNQQQKQPLTKEFIDTFDSENLNRTISTKLLGETVARKLEDAKLYTGKQAYITHLTNGKCPQIMLIATHGLFLQDTKQVSNPMMRSALALAGAKTWLSGGITPENAGKGIVFAQDIANLDLRANQLTVLLACNTARGDIKIGEGVFGLRRAFAVAGTKSLVMSLLPVPDRTSALLMERFFDNYQAGMDAIEALQNAQNYIRNITVLELRQSTLGIEILKELLKLRELSAQTQIDCHEDDKPLSHPFYWGAWVCQN
ncbi:MAG: CHAT domain-containing protein [Cyanobacteria bacterium P01_A01_bin.84]